MFETRLDAMVRDKVEQIADAMLDEEADLIATPPDTREAMGARRTGPAITGAGSPSRPAGSDSRLPKLKGALFESAVIER